MSHITPLDAFVAQHGDTALELLLHDLSAGAEIPGITPEERSAMTAIVPQLRRTWEGVLSACRDAILLEARNDPSALDSMKRNKQRRPTIARSRYIGLTLYPGRAHIGVSIADWGEGHLQLWSRIWVEPEYHPRVEAAFSAEGPKADAYLWEQRKAQTSSQYLLQPVPMREGDRWTDLAAVVARRVWPIASLVRTAVR